MDVQNVLFATELISRIPGLCYPSSYGSTCSAWDADLPPYCTGSNATGSNASSSCARQWCYVDYSTCRRSQVAVEQSRLFQRSGSGVFYSYETCDGQASQPESSLVSLATVVASTMALTIAVPENDPPLIFKRDPSTGGAEPVGISANYYNDSVPWEGALVDFYAEVSRRHGASFRFTTVSGASRAAYANAWTAGGYEASRGTADLSVPSWLTPERGDISAFTAPLYIDYFYLYVPEGSRDLDAWDRAVFAFLPFSIPLWIVCGVITIAMGAIVSFLQATEVTFNPRIMLCGLGRGTYYSLVQLLTGFEAKEASSVPLRILYVGWAFFVCLVLAAYTANFAAFLVKNPTTKQFTTLEAAIEYDANIRICHPSVITAAIIADHPDVEDNLVVLSPERHANIIVDYEAAECDALIWSENLLQMLPEVMEYFCDESLVKHQMVASVNVAHPVHDPDVGAVVSFWHNSLYEEMGVKYLNYEASYYDRRAGCEAWHSSSTSASTVFAQRQDRENRDGRRLQDRRPKRTTGTGTGSGTGRRLRAGVSRGGSVGGANTADGETLSLTVEHFFGPILLWTITVMVALTVRLIAGLPEQLEEKLEPNIKQHKYLKRGLTMLKTSADMIKGDQVDDEADAKDTSSPRARGAASTNVPYIELQSRIETLLAALATTTEQTPTTERRNTKQNGEVSLGRGFAVETAVAGTVFVEALERGRSTRPRSASPSTRTRTRVPSPTASTISQNSSSSSGNGLADPSDGRAQRYAEMIGAREAARLMRESPNVAP